MARYRKNSLTLSASGSYGNQFQFRQVDGKTIVMPIPDRIDAKTEKQFAARLKFRNAALFAKSVMANPAMKAEYAAIAKQKHFRSVTVAAMTDFLTLPQLAVAYAHQFDGSIGFPILLVLADNYKGKEMTVSISNKDGTVIESGTANFTFGDSAWSYTTTAPYASIEGLVVKVTVKDRIGRTTISEKGLNSQE